eukprot:COSAG01_NODE_1689_length_9488_cov_5.759825_9_plen_110_part_00
MTLGIMFRRWYWSNTSRHIWAVTRPCRAPVLSALQTARGLVCQAAPQPRKLTIASGEGWALTHHSGSRVNVSTKENRSGCMAWSAAIWSRQNLSRRFHPQYFLTRTCVA